MNIDWTDPAIVAALVAALGTVVVAIVKLFKKKASTNTLSQSSMLSRNTTQVQAGRDINKK